MENVPGPCADPAGYSLLLEARDPTRNIARSYAIEAGRDLFGWTVVTYRWGRIGTAGQIRQRSFAHCDDACRFVRELLRRRAWARQRLGVAYRSYGIAA